MRRLRFIIAGTLVALALGPARELPAQSLSTVVNLALNADKALTSATQRFASAQLREDQQLRTYLPTLTVAGSYNFLSDPATIALTLPQGTKTIDLNQQNAIDTSAGLQWTLFDGFRREAALTSVAGQTLLAGSQLEAQRHQTVLQTVAAYRSAQESQLQVETLESAERQTQLLLDQTKNLLSQGMAQDVDVLALKLSKLRDEQRLIVAKAELADELDDLETLTGRSILPDPPLQALPPFAVPAFAPQGLPQIQVFRFQKQILQSNETTANSGLFPRVDTSVAVHEGIPGDNSSQNTWMTYETIGVAVSWSYDWGGTSLAASAAAKNLEAAQTDEQAALDQAHNDYRRAVRDWNASLQQLDVLKTARELAQAQLSIVKTRFSQGQATGVALNTASLAQSQTDLQYRSQILALLIKENQIEALSGRQLDQWRSIK